VLAFDNQKITSKSESLYFWYSLSKENIVECAIDSKLQSVLLTPFKNKKKNWKYALVNLKKSNPWNENIKNINNYLNNLYENIREELTITIKANGKKNKYNGVYEIRINGDVVEGITSISEKRSVQREGYTHK
jgi:hypothetical protein